MPIIQIVSAALTAALLLIPAQQADEAVNSITIERRPPRVFIDGRLFEWADFTPIMLNSPKLVRGADWSGPDDLSAMFWFAWDDDALYFAAEMRDDDYLGCPEGNAAWEADALMISLRFNEMEGESKSCFLVLTEVGGEPKGEGLRESGSRYTAQPLPSLDLAVRRRDGTGPTIEGSVRWADILGRETAPREAININFEARDLGSDGKLKSISWIPSSERSPGSPSFGLALLMQPREMEGLMRRTTLEGHMEFVQLVYLPVVVNDNANNYVLDLEQNDFEIYEDGKPQIIESFRYETRPITVGLLVDCSGSMEKDIEDAKRAATSFLEALREEDRSFVIAFSHNIELLKDLDGDNASAIEAIKEIKSYGGTFLYSAIHFALGKLRFLNEKKVLVLLTDGKDESLGQGPYGQPITFEYILEEAKRQEAVVYTVAFRMRDAKAVGELSSLVSQTGGRIFTPQAVEGLMQAYNEIASDLKSQYLISYVSNNGHYDGRWRKIEVRVKGKSYDVRTRPGYYAPQR
ncbi:MAG TPA: VWA domain-containing protein [Acidobacteriota bacterium]|nr:VWA domain-containing protein [Acidobacteriota bacterium]